MLIPVNEKQQAILRRVIAANQGKQPEQVSDFEVGMMAAIIMGTGIADIDPDKPTKPKRAKRTQETETK